MVSEPSRVRREVELLRRLGFDRRQDSLSRLIAAARIEECAEATPAEESEVPAE